MVDIHSGNKSLLLLLFCNTSNYNLQLKSQFFDDYACSLRRQACNQSHIKCLHKLIGYESKFMI